MIIILQQVGQNLPFSLQGYWIGARK